MFRNTQTLQALWVQNLLHHAATFCSSVHSCAQISARSRYSGMARNVGDLDSRSSCSEISYLNHSESTVFLFNFFYTKEGLISEKNQGKVFMNLYQAF